MIKNLARGMRGIGLAAAIGFAGPVAAAEPVVVGGKGYTEQLLMAEITAQYLAAKGYEVQKRDGMGSTVLREAQLSGQVDLYWEYTGTSLITFNKVTDQLGPQESYDRVKELDADQGLVWLNPTESNNTYAIAKRADDSATADLKTLSDLASAYNGGAELSFAVDSEFPSRKDGLIGLQDYYGFKAGRSNLRAMDSGLVYQALKEQRVNLAIVFNTDGRIAAFDFVVLQDDKNFFPSYWMVPVVRQDCLDEHPNLANELNAVAAVIDEDKMRAMNASVDIDGKKLADVARSFLTENGLI